jgi:Zn-dependent M28 family amino/carboxypeptidase
VRFALWNGEEQGLHGSWGYVKAHRAELDRHVMAASFDIGSGRITGFFTGGRPEVGTFLEDALVLLGDLGPFEHVPAAILGTDHYDFMMEGVATVVANQEPATYGPNYHARSDTYDKVDLVQVRKNAVIAAAATWAFADDDIPWRRHDAAGVARLVEQAGLRPQMEAMGLWEPWQRGERGRRP